MLADRLICSTRNQHQLFEGYTRLYESIVQGFIRGCNVFSLIDRRSEAVFCEVVNQGISTVAHCPRREAGVTNIVRHPGNNRKVTRIYTRMLTVE